MASSNRALRGGRVCLSANQEVSITGSLDNKAKYEEVKTELSDLKEKYEKTEQEKQSLADQFEECKANMEELKEKGTKKPWLIWGPVVAVALTAVTAAVLFRT